MWLNKDPFVLENFRLGLPYSICLLSFLSAHEFGHYFAAKHHRIDTTLPFYIPAPPFLINPFGTMGAVIRIRSPWPSRASLFDVGIAGPIAGFMVTIAVLSYGLVTLPGKEYIYSIHPDYAKLNRIPDSGFALGNSVFFLIFRSLYQGKGFFPPMNEIYHYPFLCVGWFGLFVTALNLIPVGQLDGGHILYALVGKKWHGIIARIFFVFLLALGLSSFLHLLYGGVQMGTIGWLMWAVILYYIVKIDHPEVNGSMPLTTGRQILGWVVFVIFVLAFTPLPFVE